MSDVSVLDTSPHTEEHDDPGVIWRALVAVARKSTRPRTSNDSAMVGCREADVFHDPATMRKSKCRQAGV